MKRLARSVRGVLKGVEKTTEDIDHFFFHQANARINAKLQELMNLPDEKVPSNIERIGNLGAASIPTLLAEVKAAGNLKPGDLCVLSAFGAGYLWGSAIIRF